MNALQTSPHPKILASHLRRQAVIYVRQSSLVQVETALESQHRQYHLTERAEQFGWPSARCLVIDEDLGISGAHSFNRPGYQRLVSLVALRGWALSSAWRSRAWPATAWIGINCLNWPPPSMCSSPTKMGSTILANLMIDFSLA